MAMTFAVPNRSIAWRAVQRRDRAFDGRFVYAVSSTRIFCRPSCSSRRPTRARVEFFGSAADAERAGFRACKRCKPTSAEPRNIDRAVAQACDYLTRHADQSITLASLAREVGVSAFHLQRAFKRATGISPREYRDAERRRLLAARLRQGDTVSRATFEAGFGSSSRVYERVPRAMGMTPATLRRGGAGERIQFSIVDSTLGRVLAAYTERGVCSVAIGDDDAILERAFRAEFAQADIHRAGATSHEWIAAIVRRIDGETPSAPIPVDARGTAFQWRVWNALQEIPRGTTLSYGDLARKIGSPTAVRAVARACATNPVAVVIPCHRVVREDGAPGGYRWGLERKKELLDREKSGA
jgi:AraC family transcriptional regulator of adaptative response/methylated-DNA-[protein]-cysteine methyltransferase